MLIIEDHENRSTLLNPKAWKAEDKCNKNKGEVTIPRNSH